MSQIWRYICTSEGNIPVKEERTFEQGTPTSCINGSNHSITDITLVSTKDPTLLQVGSTISAPRQGTYLISGGLILQGGSGMTFYMTKSVYVIDNNTYDYDGGTVTLDAADGTNPRIDTIYLDTDSVLGKITGTPAVSPVKPNIASDQLELVSITVPAGASSPSINTIVLYRSNEGTANGEFNATENTSGSRINVDSASNPITGTKSITGISVVNGDAITLTNSSAITVNGSLTFAFNIINTWPVGLNLRIAGFRNNNRVSNWITVKDGIYGFSRSAVGYQRIAILTSLFSFDELIDAIKIEFIGTGAGSFNMDQIQIQDVSSKKDQFTVNQITNLTSGGGVSLIEASGGNITEYRSISGGDGISVMASGGSIWLSINASSISHDELSGVINSNSHDSYVRTIGDVMTGGLNIQQSVESLSANTGSLIVAGGLGVGGRINNAGVLGDLLVGDGTKMSAFSSGPDGFALVSSSGTLGWSATGGGGGEINTGINIGSGTGIYASKNGVQLQFKTINSDNSTVSLVDNGTRISLEVNSSVVSHDQYALKAGDTFDGVVQIVNTTDATGTGEGSLILYGGGSVVKNWYVGQNIEGGSLVINGSSTFGGDTTINNLTVNSTAIFEGNTTFNSNVSISGDIIVNGDSTFNSNVSIAGDTTTNTLIVNSNVSISGETTTNSLNTNNLTVNSNVTIGGDLIINGTVAFSEPVEFSGPLTIDDTTQSVNKDTGAIITEGGIGVEKNVNIGQNLGVLGDANVNGTITSGGLDVSGEINGAGTTGDLLVGDGSTMDVLSIGTTNQVLTVIGGTAIWADPSIIGENVGAGVGLYSTKDSLSLEFKTLISDATTISYSDNGTTVSVDVVPASISHDSLSNRNNANAHPQYVKKSGDTMTGPLIINDITGSTSKDTGALVINGGVGIEEDLFIGGNLNITGNLNIVGTVTTISSTVITIEDNALVVNAFPEATRDSGFFVQRYQVPNNSGSGDVVSTNYGFTTVTAVGGSSTTVVLPNTAPWNNSAIDKYKGYWIKIISGLGNDQVRRIKSWNPTTQTATIYGDADGAPYGDDFDIIPDATSVCQLHGTYYTGIWYDESEDHWHLGYNAVDVQNEINTSFYAELNVSKLDAFEEINGAGIKGDLLVGNGTTVSAVAVGSNGQIIRADSTDPNGVSWETLVIDGVNIGGGVGLYESSTNEQLAFKTLISNSTQISYTVSASRVSLDVNATAITHNNLSGRDEDNCHPQYALLSGDTFVGDVVIDSGTEATQSGEGALIINGGATIDGNLFVTGSTVSFGGSLNLDGTFAANGDITINSTEDSLNTATGALIVSGGIGVAKQINGAGGSAGDLLIGDGTTMMPYGIGIDRQVLIANSTNGTQGVSWSDVNAVQLRDVYIEATSPSNGDVLKYNAGQNYWEMISIETASVFLFPMFQKDPNGGDSITVGNQWANYGQIAWDYSKYQTLTTTTITSYVMLQGKNLECKIVYDIGAGAVNLTTGGYVGATFIPTTSGYVVFPSIYTGIVVIEYSKPTVDCLVQIQFRNGANTNGNTAAELYQSQMDFGF